jgi:hypothetical protein
MAISNEAFGAGASTSIRTRIFGMDSSDRA